MFSLSDFLASNYVGWSISTSSLGSSLFVGLTGVSVFLGVCLTMLLKVYPVSSALLPFFSESCLRLLRFLVAISFIYISNWGSVILCRGKLRRKGRPKGALTFFWDSSISLNLEGGVSFFYVRLDTNGAIG
jgi:hypothetical protein